MRSILRLSALVTVLLALGACKSQEETSGAAGTPGGVGVDLEHKVLRIGTLNDETGPAAAIGKPYAVGKRILARRIAAGDSHLLPPGWKIELVERDHGYNPQKAVELYDEIHDQVLFLGTSFGTPNTLPLRPKLAQDEMFAFPASQSSKMAEFEFTPPIGTPYKLEAMRAMDWAVAHAAKAGNVKAGIIYQQDDYGADGLEGWTEAAKALGVQLVSKQAVAPGQADYRSAVGALKDAGANYVLLTTLPSGTAPILATAKELGYDPIWMGNTPAWNDGFFDPKTLAPELLQHFNWVTGFPYWGKDMPGMQDFLAAYDRYGKDLSPPEFYILVSYAQGLVEIEAFRRALEEGEPTRAGYRKALHTLRDFSPGGGLLPPVDLTHVPYVTFTEARVLAPDLANRSWKVVAGYETPTSYRHTATGPAPSGTPTEAPAQ